MHLFTLDSLISYLVAHRESHPEHGAYQVEVRDHLLIAPPVHLTHDDDETVVILIGVPAR